MTAVVAEDQLAIGPGRILGRETTRFGERLKLRDALVQPESEEPLEPFRQPRQALMAETLVARRRAGEEPRHCSAAGPVVGSPADRLKARFPGPRMSTALDQARPQVSGLAEQFTLYP